MSPQRVGARLPVTVSSAICWRAIRSVGDAGATHRGLHKFVPRHHDEIELEIGRCHLRPEGGRGLVVRGRELAHRKAGHLSRRPMPSTWTTNEFDPTVQLGEERSAICLDTSDPWETLGAQGAPAWSVKRYANRGRIRAFPTGQTCILEVSDQGLRMVDRSGPNNKKEKKPCIDYFYSLKNVSFCAFHPRDHRFIGFITKHPTVQRFACHVFKGSESTRPVAEAVGLAFQRFYQKFIETAYPIEDIYIE
ncbi:GL25472 [Drosophila persimilis]|uniref:GL25472 n=1 Tax=Drosophila persimilis TaxID=7234 RepID=B4IR71_DROPE|nr:GL25472 [Drosophila persimilis]